MTLHVPCIVNKEYLQKYIPQKDDDDDNNNNNNNNNNINKYANLNFPLDFLDQVWRLQAASRWQPYRHEGSASF